MRFRSVIAITGILVSLALAIVVSGQKSKSDTTTTAPTTVKLKGRKLRGKNMTVGKPIPVEKVDDEVRVVNWCVTGKDELEMQYFPFSVFQPYLARTAESNQRFRDHYDKVKFDYELSLDKIRFSEDELDILTATRGVGGGYPDYIPVGSMHNTAHLKLKAFKMRQYPLGVKLVREPTQIEGLVIQVNQSPLGIGSATAQFMDPELDIVCNDCKHPQGRPVGCRKRTKNDIAHPVIMMYHHQMPIYSTFKERVDPTNTKPAPCVLCRKLKTTAAASPPDYMCRCSYRKYDNFFPETELYDCSLRPETQTEDLLKDCPDAGEEDCPCYRCRCQQVPGDDPCQCTEYQRTLSPVHLDQCSTVSPKKCGSEDRKDVPSCACTGPPEDEPERACHSHPAPPAPPGSAATTGTVQCQCVDGDPSLPEATEFCPTGMAAIKPCTGLPDDDNYRCRRKEVVIYPDCLTDNTRPGCSQEGELDWFDVNIADSEVLGKTDEVHANLQWYYPPCLRSRAVEFMALIIHSFANQEYEIVFFGPYELPSLSSYPEVPQQVPSPFYQGYAKLYICDDPTQVTTLLSGYDRTSRATYPFEYSYNYDRCIRLSSREDGEGGQVCEKPEPFRCDEEEEKKYSIVFDRSCAEVCEKTTLAPNETESRQRTPHGVINIITNFCVQPIAIFIGRYYKETLNRSSYRGMALWYWVHLIGSGLASVAMYIGYFHPKWVPRWHSHVIAGNTIVILLSLTYVSSWIRHTNKWLRIFAEFFHGSCGYCCSFMAYWCLHTVNISMLAKILVYTATACLGAAYFIMEFCIFYLDNKFGMMPQRRHFPTVEARLGDLPVPGANGRIFLLFVLTIIMLILTVIASLNY